MSSDGYLQIKIREQNEKIIELEKNIKQLNLKVDVHNDQIKREKELFHQAFQTLKIRPIMDKIFKEKINDFLMPILYKNKKTADECNRNAMESIALLSAKLNLNIQILGAFMQTRFKTEEDVKLFEKNLRNLDVKSAYQLFAGCSEDAKKLVTTIEKIDNEYEQKIELIEKGE